MRFGGGRPPAEQGAQSGEIAQFEVLRQKHEGVGKSHLGGIEEPGAGVKGADRPVGGGQRRADQLAAKLVELGAAPGDFLRLLARQSGEIRPRKRLEQRLSAGSDGQGQEE